MLTIENIKDTLKPLYSQYDDIYKIGIAGSYATNRATEESEEDEELDRFATEMELPVNEHSVYKTVMREVIWV